MKIILIELYYNNKTYCYHHCYVNITESHVFVYNIDFPLLTNKIKEHKNN